VKRLLHWPYRLYSSQLDACVTVIDNDMACNCAFSWPSRVFTRLSLYSRRSHVYFSVVPGGVRFGYSGNRRQGRHSAVHQPHALIRRDFTHSQGRGGPHAATAVAGGQRGLRRLQGQTRHWTNRQRCGEGRRRRPVRKTRQRTSEKRKDRRAVCLQQRGAGEGGQREGGGHCGGVGHPRYYDRRYDHVLGYGEPLCV
jgi:hypothetical protein